MKYNFSGYPKDRTERQNRNIEVAKNLTGLEAGHIFNSFTGLGGLHNLSYSDYANFRDYTEAKKVLELGQFFTPPDLCAAIIKSLAPEKTDRIADMTCGSGNFFNYHTEQYCYGCELETTAYNVAKKLYPKSVIIQGDFTGVSFPTMFDIVVGNPPFNIKTKSGLVSQYAYIKKAAQYLKPGKLLALIVPKTFLEDEYMNRHKWEELAADFDFICQAEIPSHYFDVDINTKVMYWQKAGINRTVKLYRNEYVPFDADAILSTYIAPILADNKKNAAALHLYTIRSAAEQDERTAYRLKKYLYDIKCNKTLKEKYYKKAQEKLFELRTQEKPEDMKADEWEQVKLTPEKIAGWLQSKIKAQNDKPPRKILKLVKTSYGFKTKAYCKSLKKDQSSMTLVDAVISNKQLKNKGYNKLLQRKIAAYQTQETPFADLERQPEIDKFLRSFKLQDKYSKGGALNLFAETEDIRLNDKQFEDLGLALQKKYFILNWEQGSGKSVAGKAWINFVQPKVKHVFIVAPSLAVQLTWKPRLIKYGYNFVTIENFSQLATVKAGQIVLLSFDMVRIIQRHLKKFVKMTGYNIALLVDESDELTNIHSSRTRAMLTCFRKGKYKVLTTGTTTRNTINELYPQLELLYNNSVNLMCHTSHIYKPDKDKVIQRQLNSYEGQPFPPFTGHKLFMYSFCPQKTTVFGVKKDTQDVYNSDELKTILAKTILTRTFDDVVGKRIYTIKNHQVIQNPEEKRLYQIILEEFYAIVYNYYKQTDSSRKESMLRLIRQISLLIKSTSIPHHFKDYPDSKILPQKFYKIRDLIKKWNEKVAIGTVLVETAQDYTKFLGKQFPDRKVFYIDGTKSFAARKRIIADFQATTNGILISTQQSLKSSVDIETCDKCILESLQWNMPKMAQYYFRFIRYNSKKNKEIHFVTYADSIEQNILALLMSKQKLNEFVKEGKEVSRSDMFAEFGIDEGILKQIIEKVYDEEGNLQLTWGKQTITA